MKKRMFLTVCLVILLLLSACSSNSEPQTEIPVYNKPAEPSVTGVVPSEEPHPEIQPSDPEISNPGPEISYNEIFNPDFKGVTITTESSTPVKSPFSNANLPILSYDEETDTLYYVKYSDRWDQTKDNFIYAYKNGKHKLVVDMPANYVNYYGGALYFTSKDDILALFGLSTVRPEGKLYKYDISTKKYTCLVEEDVYNIVMHEDFIYYTTALKYDNGLIEGSGANYRIPISGGAPEAVGEYTIFENIDYFPYFYGEYQLKTSKIDYSSEVAYGYLELVSGQDVIKITENIPIPYMPELNFRIDGDKLWFYYYKNKNYCIASIDLSNGETKVFSTDWPVIGKDGNLSYNNVISYTVHDNELYVFISGKERAFIKYDDSRNEFVDIPVDNKNQQLILTDGKHLYGYYSIVNGISSLYRLNPLENGGFEPEGIF